MKANIGSVDRTVRIVAGILIVVVGLAKGSWWGLIGLLPLATAFVRWCPAYTLFGMSTCARGEVPPDKAG